MIEEDHGCRQLQCRAAVAGAALSPSRYRRFKGKVVYGVNVASA